GRFVCAGGEFAGRATAGGMASRPGVGAGFFLRTLAGIRPILVMPDAAPARDEAASQGNVWVPGAGARAGAPPTGRAATPPGPGDVFGANLSRESQGTGSPY